MALVRVLKHLFYPPWLARRRFPPALMARIERAIAEAEVRHGGEIRFALEATLDFWALLRGVTARQRALQVFAELGVWDTEANNGVLIYLLLAERDVEIVADRGFNGRVAPERWAEICRQMEQRFAKGDYADGVLAGIAAISAEMARHYPAQTSPDNELPDRPVRLD